MIPAPLEQVDLAALRALVEDEVPESKTLEYKLQVPGTAKSDAVRLLAAVSSFANTAGGDLLIGIREEGGLPTELVGIEVDNLDQEGLRLEQIIRNGLEPRLPRVDIRFVPLADERCVVLIRVPESWASPHRVKQNHQFYARHSRGKAPLDVGELRVAFALSESVAERIRAFRADRIARVLGRQAPVPLAPGGCLVVHLVPLGAFRAPHAFGVDALQARGNELPPLARYGGWSVQINLDGLVTCSVRPPQPSHSYTQIFRSGAAEGVSVLGVRDGRMLLPSTAYEEEVAEFVRRYLEVAVSLEIELPFYVFLSLVGVRGCQLGMSRRMWPRDDALADDVLTLPEVLVEDREGDPYRVLRPAFDMVWNAFGYSHSMNYDSHGNWRQR